MDRLGTYMDALRVLARTNDPNRVVLIERNIKEYLKIEIGPGSRGALTPGPSKGARFCANGGTLGIIYFILLKIGYFFARHYA